MFKRLALALCVGSLSMSPALAQQEDNTAKVFVAKQPCDVLPKMMEIVKGYKEELLFMGEGMSFNPRGQGFMGGMMFFTNQDTNTWSMIQLYGDGTACLVMNGRGFVPYSGPTVPERIEH